MKVKEPDLYQGKPCKRGHPGIRYTSSRACVQCTAECAARRYAKDPTGWLEKCKPQDMSTRREWYDANKPSQVIRWVLREQLRRVKRGKNLGTCESLGYTVQQFQEHLERLFQPGMNWRNHGLWHVDHVKSVADFLREGVTDPAIVNALSNLQPLWKLDNLTKGAKSQSIVFAKIIGS